MPERLHASSLQHLEAGALVLSAPAGISQSTDTTAHGSWGVPSALLQLLRWLGQRVVVKNERG